MLEPKKIIVVGAGPAGMMAAIRAAQLGPSVTLLEKNPYPGRKLLLSGKGRCNLTNACGLQEFMERFSRNGPFLRDAFKKFFNRDLIDFFESRGLKLKTERQLRVFPVTDDSASVVRVLKNELLRNKVNTIYKAAIEDIRAEAGRVKAVITADGRLFSAQKVILATGGLSFSFTGSTGEGLKMAGKSGHHIVETRAGLIPLLTKQRFVRELNGLTLKNIRLRFVSKKKEILSGIGELLFTQNGVSGPLVLSLSGQVMDWLRDKQEVFLKVDLKPALTQEQLKSRLMREFSLNPRKIIQNVLKELLPKRLISVVLELSGIDADKQVSQINRSEREGLISVLKDLRMDISGSPAIEEAMVTRGGVSLKEIDPRTMESRLIKGLYFCGEMIDVDADTGGFNLQAAFSTGYLAGESAALSVN